MNGGPIEVCPRCRYDLRTLPRNHRCPECGFEYDESMRVWRVKFPIFAALGLLFLPGIVCASIFYRLVQAGTAFQALSYRQVIAFVILSAGSFFVLLTYRSWNRWIITSDKGILTIHRTRSRLWLWDEVAASGTKKYEPSAQIERQIPQHFRIELLTRKNRQEFLNEVAQRLGRNRAGSKELRAP